MKISCRKKKIYKLKIIAEINLRSNEQVTFIGKNKFEYDVTKKELGFLFNTINKWKIKKNLD